MLYLHSDIKYIKGVGEKRAGLFNGLGVFDVGSLINFFPRKYEDWTRLKTVALAESGDTIAVKATMITPVEEAAVRRGLTLYKCRFSDGESVINVTIFNNKYQARSLKLYSDYILYGRLEKTFTSASMSAPKIESAATAARIHPIYPSGGGLTSAGIASAVRSALSGIDKIPETLGNTIREKYGLMELDDAVRQIHFPDSAEQILLARKRLIFEELLTLQLGLLKLRGRKKAQTPVRLTKDFSREFEKLLPFRLTGAQTKAIAQCTGDLMGVYPMNRLLQGDVGSGKTAVGASLCYTAVKNGYQCALMAPTEILAQQHYDGISKILKPAGIRVSLLTGSSKASEKRLIKKNLMDGEIDMLIGTHAIIQNDVAFKNLALVITDEQHRFGVRQRASLAEKGTSSHTLVMSATPIPRTLALILYGDLDISLLDEMPPGRQPVRTDVVDSSYHKRIYNFIKAAAARGEQSYIICPMVDENDEVSTDLKSAKRYADELAQGEFAGYNLGLIHGKMKAAEKESVMKSFAGGDISVLVATTVVEVGVDVKNATVMVIENAERFGLSQLHQLRGRIGRGSKKSYCILVSDSESESAAARLMTMKRCSNGFEIADEDLKARGPGDFFGERQHGLPQLKIADMAQDMDTLRLTQQCAREILERDYNLDLPENKRLCDNITKMFRKTDY